MQYWTPGIVVNLLALAVLLGLAAVLRNRIGPLRRLGIPDCIVAGTLGLLVGPSVLDLVPYSIPDLELLIYHGFALVFIAVGLQRSRPGTHPGGARSVAIAIPTLAVMQMVLAFAIVAAWQAWGGLHPGFGLLPMLGFSQGPGQALALGAAWEPLGMVDGAQLGLTFAAAGFATCIVLGIPVVAWARRAGWVTQRPPVTTPVQVEEPSTDQGAMEPLSASVVIIAVIYAAVFGIIAAFVSVLPEGSSLIPTAWGFHFIVGALLAIAVRRGARASSRESWLHDRLIARLAVLAVDITTTAALCAIELAILGRWLAPIVAICVVVGGATLLASIWMARRAFPEEPFEHALLMFGMSTGTLPTGLALLRTVDPHLQGPVARNATLGISGSVPFMAPLLVGVLPFAVSLWPQGQASSVGIPLAVLAVYAVGLAIAWKLMTPARRRRPWTSLWPPDP